jgi:hypothetical protein
MRWLLQIDTRNGKLQPIGGAKTTQQRDQAAWAHLVAQLEPSHAWRVLATDTRTGKVVELSLALRRKSRKATPLAPIDNG